jgi:mono/diheme cytochrome c family protein
MQNLSKSMGLLVTLMLAAGCGGGDQAEENATPAEEPGAAAPAPAPPAGGAPAAGGAASPEMIAAGQQVYSGAGICFTCHGAEGVGTALGPNLADDQWIWIENPTQDLQTKLVDRIREGVPQPREHPAPMPPMGGATLTEEQLQSVAAYVASL